MVIMTSLWRERAMIELLPTIFLLLSYVSIVYLLMSVDQIVHQTLYQFGLEFSYDWANRYWMLLRISLVLLGLMAAAASMNLTFTFWQRLRKPGSRTTKAETASTAHTPSLFQCRSCGRAFRYARRVHINICPFCNTTLVPAKYMGMGKQLLELQLDMLKTVVRDYLKSGIFTIDDLKV